MIWGSILSCIAILFGIGAYAYKLAQDWKLDDTQSDFNIKWTKIFSYFMFALGSIVVFLTIFLRKSIMMAMACVRPAAAGPQADRVSQGRTAGLHAAHNRNVMDGLARGLVGSFLYRCIINCIL